MRRLFVPVFTVSLLLATSAQADPLVVAMKDLSAHVAYAKRPLTLDGSASTQGPDVKCQWSLKGGPDFPGAPPVPPIADADQPVAHFTPPAWGVYHFTLTLTRAGQQKTGQSTAHIINDPEKDDLPAYPGAKKVLYKHAPDALGGQATLYLHIFDPQGWKATDQRGVVLLFHGGGWNGGSPDRYLAEAQYWAARGLVGITGQYRLGAREGTTPPDCVADAKSAVRYLRAHAAELGIDPHKIAVGGESAGAHIAACAGTLPAYNDPHDDLAVSCVPNALLLYFPYKMVTTVSNRKDDMSPLHFVTPATPPTLFIAGEMDDIAPARRGIDWGDAMKGGTNPFRLLVYRRAHHPSGNHDLTKPGLDNDLVRQTDLFLVSLGFMTGVPTVSPMDPAALAKLHLDPQDFKFAPLQGNDR